MQNEIEDGKDKILFTPGPLTTSPTVKEAMLKDLGSRDNKFINLVAEIRNSLLEIANVQKGEYEAIIMQGSGTFGIEATIGSTVKPDGRMLVIINGAYGKRIKQIAQILKIDVVHLEYPENQIPVLAEIEEALINDKSISNVWVVHCETTTGIVNPVTEIGEIVARYGCKYHVDAMSSFGAMPIDLKLSNIDFLVTSTNKCLEGVPGCSLIIAKRESLISTEGYARSLSLDLFSQWNGLEANGQFRFTPPIQVVLALSKAIEELKNEGGIEGRANRYNSNCILLSQGMERLGFKQYIAPQLRGYIISSFYYPENPNFFFEIFYQKLSNKGFVIYPGKLSDVDCFRIGNIGHIFENDITDLLDAINITLAEMNVGMK